MTHHTDLRDADELVSEIRLQLADALREIGDRRGARVVVISETVRNALRECVAATRRNDTLNRCVKTLAGEIGESAKSAIVHAVLEGLQAQALLPERRAVQPLPRGVSTPVPSDERPTPVAAAPARALEVDATPEGAKTIPLTPKPPIGPWNEGPWGESLPPTKPVKPRRR